MQIRSTKRQKEQARKEHRLEKAAKKEERKREKADRATQTGVGEDPDIAGIVPGPQPQAEE